MVRLTGFVVAVVVCSVAVGPFLVKPAASSPGPVTFDDTVTVGGTYLDQFETPNRTRIPKAQVFYTRYRYVVGYYGIGTAVDQLSADRYRRQFGDPQAVYVTDFAEVNVSLSEEGYPVTDRPGSWVNARDAVYVQNSDAQLPSGPVTLPFSDRSQARAFADEYGGTLVGWTELRNRSTGRDPAATARDRVDEQHTSADRSVADAATLRNRSVSVVVGEDAPTITDAIERAPPNTTVLVPDGTYDETLTINKSITLSGPDAVIHGDGNGSVINVTANRTGIVGPTIEGVGNKTRNPGAVDSDEWDANIVSGYGRGDAGITVAGANGTLVADLTIDTPASGVLFRNSPEMVVSGITVNGSEEWQDGFMGVVAIRSPGVIERSTFEGGRDAVYTHRSEGIVVRNNTMRDGRYGVHLMYTSAALVANNHIRDQDLSGIVIMTGPQGVAIVGNDVRGSEAGASTTGTDQYVARNVFAGNRYGIKMAAPGSIYEHNVLTRNEIGAKTTEVVPTSRIEANDFVANDRPAEASSGPLRIWTVDGDGNYWNDALGRSDGETLGRTFVPTDATNVQAGRTDGVRTLVRSPGATALRAVRDRSPGLRPGAVVDTAPLASPADRERLDQALGDRHGSNASSGPTTTEDRPTHRPIGGDA